ncbi:MAG TPA: MarR family winged helix-turn-helix transcriptional regulator [Gaiellaceae bacterium]|nr:MarR family winged helix-turn-helix transcriptional regulator [Gaiellaceae bacterium]
MPRRRPVEIPPQKDVGEPPRMHVLFDVMAAYNVTDPYVEYFLGDPKLADSYGLMSLIGASGSITTTEVAARLGIAVTTASDRIRRLENRGFAERTPNPADGRSHLVSLTEQGRAAFETTWKNWGQATAELEQELSIPSAQIADAVRELDRAMREILNRRRDAGEE